MREEFLVRIEFATSNFKLYIGLKGEERGKMKSRNNAISKEFREEFSKD